MFFSPLSLNNYNQNKLSVYPNPASNYLDGMIEGDQSIYLIELFDMQGRKVLSQQLLGDINRLDVQYLERGTYMLKMYTKGHQLTKPVLLN